MYRTEFSRLWHSERTLAVILSAVKDLLLPWPKANPSVAALPQDDKQGSARPATLSARATLGRSLASLGMTGRLVSLVASLLLPLALAAQSTAVAARPELRTVPIAAVAVRGIARVGMTVSDMDRAMEFYSTTLGFRVVSDVEVAGPEYEQLQGVFGLRMRVVRLQLGDEQLELTEYLAPKGRPIPVDSRSQDRWFQHIAIITSDMDGAYAWLRRHKAQHASSGPQRLPDWNPNAGGIKAFYFKDPDGHTLEVLQFPPGKGMPKWQRPASGGRDARSLFLGIDHTAIVVGSTDASLAFYRDLLGLRIAGESENYGTEQEHLNNVFGARLRITALRAQAGPGIELLEYLAPRDGRPYPADARANDLVHWQTTLVAPDAQVAALALRASGATFLSPEPVIVPEARLGFRKGLLVRDPDGHVMEVVEQ
jgi:catechol 2,3-dioxygenase-like lactoylglutathione lyase family enzyme